MAPYISDEVLRQRAGEDVVEFVHELKIQAETHKARADAAIINAEQACSQVEQRYMSLAEQFGKLEQEKQQSVATLDRRSAELAEAHGKAHKLELDAIKHDSDLERVSFELGEVRKSKRELLEVVEQKNAELDEKNASIKSYLEKIVNLTDERSNLEGKLRDHDADMVRSSSSQSRLQQEKELLEQHNSWLNEELTAKVKGLMEERCVSAELEADLQSKLIQAEKLSKEASEALQRSKARVADLEAKLLQTREELRFTKEQTALQENQLAAEIATANKLADLYKESSDDWSSKSNDLEGVVKAIETHLNQVESDYREKLDREIQARESAVKEAADLREKLDKVVADRNSDLDRNADVLALPGPPAKTVSESMDRQLALELHGEGAVLPSVAVGISGTALAAALLRDGWSLATMYSKYQEAVDAWRHEKHERKNSQTLLERVLHEIEMKAEVILDEREEHVRMIESYRIMEEKLYHCMEDQNSLDSTIKDLKADLRRKERDVKGTQKEISDLQVQVASLLKECAELKQKYEAGDLLQNGDASSPYYVTAEPDSSAADVVISEKLVTFKDIKGMVEQNSQLRILVRDLAQENEQKELELKEYYSAELDKRAEAAANKVVEVLQRYKEKEEIIEALQGSVAMYKRLYEEELKSRYTSPGQLMSAVDFTSPGEGGKDYSRLLQSSQEEIRSIRSETAAKIKTLEEELTKAKLEVTNARVERARVDAEGALAREQMVSLTLEAENRRKEMDAVLARNMEFCQTITNYQQQIRESSEKLHAAEELANRLKIEASILEKEKELLAAAEKRASDEVALLSDRAHRVQASLDTFQSIEEARESTRVAEMKKLQDEWSRMQKEWTESQKELEVERKHSRDLTVLRDKAVSKAMDRVEAVSKELADALKAMSTAETRAQVAESRCSEVEANLKKADAKIVLALTGGKRVNIGDKSSSEIEAEILANYQQAKEEVEHLKEDLQAAKSHTEQYKRIAEASEEALKQLEAAHNQYKGDVDRTKEGIAAETKNLKDRVAVLESDITEKEAANATMAAEMEVALQKSQKEIACLQEKLSSSQALLQDAEVRVSTLKQEVDKHHHQWRDAQQNYERQVLLQADTIRELTAASDRLTKLEQEEAALQIRAETAESQLASLQVSWAMEKSSLESRQIDAEKKWKDVEEQNRLLLDRMEAVHITSVEHARKAAAETGSDEAIEVKNENDLQNVIRYLRRSKETAETEVSLLKQERLRLQRQLDAALHAAEDAQSSLRREQKNARASLYSDEEFKSLQAQVREINLMRESNAQLREENRRNFEDSKESRDKVRQAHAELEPVQQQLREKEVELESSGKELEMQRAETQRWQNRAEQLLEKYKAIDVEDYEHKKTELAGLQEDVMKIREELKVAKSEAEAAKKEVEAAQDKVEIQQNVVSEKESRLTEQETRLLKASEAETVLRAELDRFKGHSRFLKRKNDTLAKEKDELSKEHEALSKQVEEFKATAGKRALLETRQEAARQEATLRQESAARLEQAQKESESILKEKDARVQILEKTLERERESLRKEKMFRQRDQKTFYDVAQKAVVEKKKFLDELETFKQEKLQVLEKLGSASGASEPLSIPEVEGRAATYLSAMNVIEGVAASVLDQIAHLNPPASAASASPVLQSISLTSSVNVPDIAQPPPVTDASAVVSEIPAVSSVAAVVVPPPNAGAPTVSASGPGSLVGGASTSVTAPGTLTASVPRPPIRPATSGISPPVARPPVRQPPTQAVVPDQREREMAQLRAQIQEKEKSQAQASVTQARKSARRLIRPRIEPEVVTELGDTVDGTADVTETDMEPEEAKLLTVSNDAVELASSSASAPLVTVVTAPALDSIVPPVVTISISASIQPSASVRKRPAAASEPSLIDEVSMDLVVNSDSAPPQKRPRAVELSPEEISQETALIVSTVPVEANRQDEMIAPDIGQGDQIGQDIFVSDVNPVPVATEDSVTAEISVSESERERPVTEISDIPPQKRLRFIRPEVPLLSQLVVVQEPGVLEDEAGDKKTVSEADDPVDGTHLTKQVTGEAEVVGEGSDPTEVSADDQRVHVADVSSLSEALQGGEPQASSDLPSVPDNAVEESLQVVPRTLGPADGVDLSRSGSDVGASDMASDLFNLEDVAQVLFNQAPHGTDGMESAILLSESDIPVGDVGMQRDTDINPEVSGAEEVQEGEEEAEEGEISMDVGMAETALSVEPGTRDSSDMVMDPEKVVEEIDEANAHDAVLAPTIEQNVKDTVVVENQEVTTVEVQRWLSTNTADVVINVAGPADTSAQEQRAPEEQQTESSSIVTRQSLKSINPSSNTTIHLAERARERAALRRGGVTLPSPTGRGRARATRGSGKRAPGASRGGRVISTGVRGRGQPGGNTTPPNEAIRTTQEGGSGATAPIDQAEINSTPNPYETLPREGED